ncbi:hypothetical protein BV197_01066A, partial [Haemophilus influenzae]|jgi:hypothetical protein
MTSY